MERQTTEGYTVIDARALNLKTKFATDTIHLSTRPYLWTEEAAKARADSLKQLTSYQKSPPDWQVVKITIHLDPLED